MKSQKKLTIITIILGVLVIIMGCFIAYIYLNPKDITINNQENNNSTPKEEEDNNIDNNSTPKEEEDNDIDNNSTTKEKDNNTTNYELKEIDYSDLFDMGSGIIIGNASSYNEDGVELNLYSDGKIYYVKKKESIGTQKEMQISNIIKVINYANLGSENGPIFYMLNKDGELFSIDEKNIINGDITPQKVSDVPKFIDIGIWRTYKPNAGGGVGAFGITTEGKIYSIAFSSV